MDNKIIKDEIFGEIKNFETEVEWLGRKISVSFDGGIESDWSEEKKVEEVKGCLLYTSRKILDGRTTWNGRSGSRSRWTYGRSSSRTR